MAQITCGNCHSTHQSVDEVRACYDMRVTDADTTYTPLPPTDRQLSYIAHLREDRAMTPIQEAVDVATLSKQDAAAHIDSLLQRPKAPPEPRLGPVVDVARKVTPVTEGVYKRPDGTIVKVVQAVNGSGHLYAKVLHGKTFVYQRGAMASITPEMKMTLAEAAEFGKLYGQCCVCGRTLTDERSIAAGIGPVCAGKGWW